MLNIADFDYPLPPELIANEPLKNRADSRLMLVDRQTGEINHTRFNRLIDSLTPNDVLVLNETKVFPARLFGLKRGGDPTDVLLIKPLGENLWEALGRNLKLGSILDFDYQVSATVTAKHLEAGTVSLQFSLPPDQTLAKLIDQSGHTPTPPYLHTHQSERDLRTRYQTVYAKEKGSVAAPTAGLHFTPQLLTAIKAQGVNVEKITLHVGPGTFGTLYPHHLESKTLHPETYFVDSDTITRLHQAKQAGKRIIAVGTTTCRTLETIFAKANQKLEFYQSQSAGDTRLFIFPPYRFHFVDALITNFHLPQSSLLMLVTAFVSTPNAKVPYKSFQESLMGSAYQTAIEQKYRFFSFGDAMMIS